MFINNKYCKIYYNIILRAKSRTLSGYKEKHHIIPRCMGGTDVSDNLVELTAREHFICHLLLIRMTTDLIQQKLVFAAWQQSRPSLYKEIRVTSRVYEYLRKKLSETYTGKKRAPFSEQWKENMRKGAKTRKKVEYSEERIAKIRALGASTKGKKLSSEHREKIGRSVTGESTGDPEVVALRKAKRSKDSSDRFTGVPKVRCSCVYCKTEITVNILPRFHGDNCKFKE